MNKEKWLQLAEIIDAFRTVPRLIMAVYLWMCIATLFWVFGLEDPTNGQIAFATTIISAGTGWFGFYVTTGRKWNDK